MTDQRLESIIATLLRTGVILAASVVLIGGAGYLIQHGAEQPAYQAFHGEPEIYRSMPGIVRTALHLNWGAVIQLGLLLLIATPVARVALGLIAFALERDRIYVIVTAIVLTILLSSLIAAH